MALMFQRLARNYIKNGYFPTDSTTIEQILRCLTVSPSADKRYRLFDPCCGEGSALAEVGHYIDSISESAACSMYGIEFDEQRAAQANTLLHTVLHSDVNDSFFGRQQYSLLWLNPPYGQTVSDSLSLSGKKTQRLEKMFFHQTVNSLAFGGVMVLIIPANSLNESYASALCSHFDELRVFKAGVDDFNQVVVLGRKKRVSDKAGSTPITKVITQGKDRQELPSIPDHPGFSYLLPDVHHQTHKLFSLNLDAAGLKTDIQNSGNWHQFSALFQQHALTPRRPLTPMSDWHLALALASGQVNGRVTSSSGRTLLIKGDTYKTQLTDIKQQFDDDGNPREIRTSIDTFIPSINGIDLTVDSLDYGAVIQVK